MASVLELLPATRIGVKYPGGVFKSERHFLDFVIDGESLWEKVGKPRDTVSVICFDYSREETVQAVNRLPLTEKSVVPGDRRPLFICSECGDIGCGAVTAFLVREGESIVWKDFGFRATHLMTLAAKQIVSTFYGQSPRYSYFHGCSTGGQQALMEAQRFPDDYDGILGGSPANNRTHVHTNAVWAYKKFHATPASYFTPDKVALVTKNVVAACALKSGGLASDNFLTDPRFCDWDPGTIQCPLLDGPDCLTADQIRAARAIYDGPRNPTNGHLIYPGSVRGSENAGDLANRAAEFAPPAAPTGGTSSPR